MATESLEQTDTITPSKKEVATDGYDPFDPWYDLKKQKEKDLKLDSLESGFDSLQIRIWFEYALIPQSDLIVIARTGGKWKAKHYYVKLTWEADDRPGMFKATKIEELSPRSGWPAFINKLTALGIMILPDMYAIPDFTDNVRDGSTYNVEIATKNQYRFYGYHMPSIFADKLWQAKKMTEILKLLDTEGIIHEYLPEGYSI